MLLPVAVEVPVVVEVEDVDVEEIDVDVVDDGNVLDEVAEDTFFSIVVTGGSKSTKKDRIVPTGSVLFTGSVAHAFIEWLPCSNGPVVTILLCQLIDGVITVLLVMAFMTIVLLFNLL